MLAQIDSSPCSELPLFFGFWRGPAEPHRTTAAATAPVPAALPLPPAPLPPPPCTPPPPPSPPLVYLTSPSAHPPTQARGVSCVCTVELHLSYLDALQLHSCICKHHRRNSNILQCCSLGLYEDAGTCGRHKAANNFAKSAVAVCCAGLLLNVLSSSSPDLLTELRPFLRCIPLRPSRPFEQWKLLSSRIPKDSSDSRTAIVPSEDPAPASSQLDVVLNCQLFTQAITEAVILCKYSR